MTILDKNGGILIIQKLTESITNQLYTVFEKPNIYVEHIKQGFLLPCFCVKCVKTEEKPYLSNRYKLFNKIEITYFPQEKINTSNICNEVLTNLYNNFLMLNFEKGLIKGENMEGYVEDGLVKFFIEYNFYVFKKEDTDKMNRLFI